MIYFLKHFGFLSFILCSASVLAQTKAKDYIIEGNTYYQKGKFDNAEYAYKKAAIEDPTSVKANYNLGNALFEQKRYKESMGHYQKSAEMATSTDDKHKAYHNLGNAYMQEKDYQNALSNFKQALKNDPTDEATRYNYALAKKMLEKEQKKDNKKDNKQNQDQQKDQQEQNKQNNQQQQSDQQGQQQKDNQKSQDQQADQSQNQREGGNPKSGGENGNNQGKGNSPNPQIQQGGKGKGSEHENALDNTGDGVLKALQQQEMKTQRRVIQQKADRSKTSTSKDW